MKKGKGEDLHGADALDAMLGDIQSEQETIEAEEATAEQQAISDQLASDEQRAGEMALVVMGYVDAFQKGVIDGRLGFAESDYERAASPLGLQPVILKYRLWERAEPPEWVKEWSPIVIALVFAGSIGYRSYNEFKALKAQDAANAESEQENPPQKNAKAEQEKKSAPAGVNMEIDSSVLDWAKL